ncbi:MULTISPECIES: SDR family oxidoreductase [Nocardia]|uniref:SDR family NAD(P)-dependent oxidoreductase n=1 Tax=Nocardia TaxID=1817 RepID=UPI00265A5E86|nr:SDR family NAD(P)-dependent oxidoreductase [Nocardia sp. PE-7]WKG12421.1 SDR family NAD(P)-dependent oxidoreductase [Nocardia sp. PE-7]
MERKTHNSDLERTALITGASSGIGAAFARMLAGQGWHIVAVGRDRRRLDILAREIGAEVLVADLVNEHDLGIVENRLRDRVQLLINNAGYTTYGAFADLELTPEVGQLILHAVVPLRLCHTAAQSMQPGGRILNIASLAGIAAAPGLASYGASKAALISLSESLHHELRDKGITVTCVCAGYTRTELQTRAGVDASALPSAMWTDPEFVAEKALLANERGRALVSPGRLNTLTATLMRLLPRALARRAAAGTYAKVAPVGLEESANRTP